MTPNNGRQKKPQNFSNKWRSDLINKRPDYDVFTVAVINALHMIMDADGGNACAGIKRIAALAHCGETTTKARLKLLADDGQIHIHLRGGIRVETPSGVKYTNRYEPLPFRPRLTVAQDDREVTVAQDDPQVTDLTVARGDLTVAGGVPDSRAGRLQPAQYDQPSTTSPDKTKTKSSEDVVDVGNEDKTITRLGVGSTDSSPIETPPTDQRPNTTFGEAYVSAAERARPPAGIQWD